MAVEGEHYGFRVAYANTLYYAQQATALLRSMGTGLAPWL